jgi:poly-gamma-glutamate synthesis protein (capsule biosynthesis protein)
MANGPEQGGNPETPMQKRIRETREFIRSLMGQIDNDGQKTEDQKAREKEQIAKTSQEELKRQLDRHESTPENKDSTDFGGEDSNVTSYVSGYFTQNEGLLDETPVTMLFGGDMQFDRYIRSVTTKRGGAFVFDGLRSELQKADLVVTNLEGPITDSTSVSETSTEGSHDNYVFTFPPETAALLKRENIRLVNIGNNHILNFREDGVRQTQGSLEAAGVESFGSPLEGDTRYVIRDNFLGLAKCACC